jgi:isocitrate dehydrogenase (NAD+)
MLSAILMLRHLNKNDVADRVERAIRRVYDEGRHLTRDVGGGAGTEEFTDAVIGALT